MKCEQCKYKGRLENTFPCNECDKNKHDVPVTCYDCRFYIIGCTKDANDIETCEDFDWW